jgi:hypothetical protein
MQPPASLGLLTLFCRVARPGRETNSNGSLLPRATGYSKAGCRAIWVAGADRTNRLQRRYYVSLQNSDAHQRVQEGLDLSE